ncbi:NO-insensitive guanylyl cyclase III [Salpingoeca rosetta]|uniref:guanylate cyclase n=1 Tax=Salpingoeca rosetta (strain ATCC 50818 / BSB-021) TaxID=946362 RepID=F2UP57_SALR5|nr:NO-insensitive guanylyl cyclase III [Salpingoeca rosetta]EGD79412.1 NO-insensitive guanylyl cyclase III [Salpingoeca rosetta]|eukprot:XP_004989181.1 NO-insensitive guanylyl cyclase III [Salpingoeca rosetta]
MYGLLHKALTAWISSLPDGEDLLTQVMAEVDFDGRPDDFFRFYSNDQTGSFLTAVAKVTGRSQEDCKFEAGRFFLAGILETGYGSSLRTLGSDFFTLLGNLDSLHESFTPSFPKMRAPSIRPVRNDDGSMTVHYYSSNAGLSMFMMGALEAAALRLFDLDIDIHHRIKKGQGSNHDVFHVYMDPRGFGESTEVDETIKEACTIDLGKSVTNDLFPWHFAFDRDMKIVSLGKHLAARFEEPQAGKPFKKVFRMLRPVDISSEFDELKDVDGVSCLFSVDAKLLRDDDAHGLASGMQGMSLMGNGGDMASDMRSSLVSCASSFRGSNASSSDMLMMANRLYAKADNIKLHGQLTYNSDHDVVVFFGTPALRSLEEMEAQRIELSEMPLHSHGREFLYGSMFQSASAKNSNEVDRRMAELDQSMLEIQDKKKQIDGLLHSILPPVVASSLARGEIPPAEQYDNVSVLFSDIAGFTNISSDVPATDVMEMLHELFVKFDNLADKHGCYKVETIGDAYMVAAGCPEECEDHALRIARLAIEMVHTAKSVVSPLDGEPIRIRVGLHSGPLMAGVVGRARPRYCFFGSTVSVASLMESNGLPGCIQTSYRFTQALPSDHPFELVSRGHIDIAGKGLMKTYLLIGAHDPTTTTAEPLLPVEGKVQDLASQLLAKTTNTSSVGDRMAQVSTYAVRTRMARRRSHHV